MFCLVMLAESPFGTSITFLPMADMPWILQLLILLLKRILSLPPVFKQSNTTTANSYTFLGSKKHFLFLYFPKLVSNLLPEYVGFTTVFPEEKGFPPSSFYLKNVCNVLCTPSPWAVWQVVVPKYALINYISKLFFSLLLFQITLK